MKRAGHALLLAYMLLTFCVCCVPHKSISSPEQQQTGGPRMVYSLRLTEAYYSDQGLRPGDEVPDGTQDGVVITIGNGSTFSEEFLLRLVDMEWEGPVTVIAHGEPPDGLIPDSWTLVLDTELAKEFHPVIQPTLYIIKNKTVGYRAAPFRPYGWQEAVARLQDDDLWESGTSVKVGERLAGLEFYTTDDQSTSLPLNARGTVVIFLSSGCSVCHAVIEWVPNLSKVLENDPVFVISSINDMVIDSYMDLAEEYAEELKVDLTGAQRGHSDEIKRMLFDLKGKGKILIDKHDQVSHALGVAIWPTVAIIDGEGYIQAYMVLSLAEGPTDGLYFAEPIDAILNEIGKVR